MAIVYCGSEICFSQRSWEKTKDDMKRTFEANGINVSYEAQMPLEHELAKFDQVLEEIKTKARSKCISVMSNVRGDCHAIEASL